MRPVVARALRNPISRIGIALTTASALLFLFLLVFHMAGFLRNPYVGLLVFILVPTLFIVGLILIPIGLRRERRRAALEGAGDAWPRLDLNDPVIRRGVLLLITLTAANLGIVSLASFGAVQVTESNAFCGQVCHAVMEPEFVAHQAGAHGQVHCVTCHVGPGAGGFLTAKLNGTRQLLHVAMGSYPRPIPTPVENIPDVRTSCEQCHRPDRFVGDKVKVLYEHADDEANTPTVTTVKLHVGGAFGGTKTGSGIHGHMNRANEVEYVTADEKREQIPYVRVSTPDGQVREYFAEGVSDADIAGKPRRRMDCLDCHNRPAHRFSSSAEREVDGAIGAGQISQMIPFIRREAVKALKAEYPDRDTASREIERSIREAMSGRTIDQAQLRQAIGVTQAIYRRSVFPAMKVTWGTYPNQTGHTISTGCFRCHDDSHKTKDGKAIGQDCELCHSFE